MFRFHKQKPFLQCHRDLSEISTKESGRHWWMKVPCPVSTLALYSKTTWWGRLARNISQKHARHSTAHSFSCVSRSACAREQIKLASRQYKQGFKSVTKQINNQYLIVDHFSLILLHQHKISECRWPFWLMPVAIVLRKLRQENC